MGNILCETPIVGVDIVMLLDKSMLLVGSATVPLEGALLVLDVKADHINFIQDAIVVIKEFNLVVESILNCRDKMIVQHCRCDAVVSSVHDWETKSKSFLVRGLIIWRVLLCTTRGSYHIVIVRQTRDVITIRGGGAGNEAAEPFTIVTW